MTETIQYPRDDHGFQWCFPMVALYRCDRRLTDEESQAIADLAMDLIKKRDVNRFNPDQTEVIVSHGENETLVRVIAYQAMLRG